MTTSTDDKKSKKKVKGPIRWEAVIPLTIILVVIIGYFTLFFDSHVRLALQHFISNANGAEVNIGHFKTSVLGLSLEVGGIEMTNPEKPSHNRLSIGKIHWKLNPDALLRAKVVIDDASILAIQFNSPRKYAGFVIPPPPPPPPSEGPSAFDKKKQEVLDNAEKEFKKNVFGDIAGVLGGNDPAAQLKNVETSLKAKAKVEAVKADLAAKEAAWKERIAKLPTQKDLDGIVARSKAVKTTGFSNPAEVQKSIQDIQGIIQDVEAKKKAVEDAKNSIGTDSTALQNSMKEIENTIKEDIKDLENRIKLPKLDVESISRVLFGPAFLSKIKQFEKYAGMAKKYMPPKKTAEEKKAAQVRPEERAKGKTYRFGHQNSYPVFWLKKAQISSKASDGPFAGDMKGTLTDVTSDPPMIGKPIVAAFEGSFPNQGIKGILGRLTFDHTTDVPVESLKFSVAEFPIEPRALSDSPEAKLSIENAQGAADVTGQLKDEELTLNMKTTMTKSKFAVASNNDIIRDVLSGVVNGLPQIYIAAGAKGRWDSLAFNLDSNLGTEISKGFEKQLQAKINEARAKIQALVNEKVGAEKAKLEGEINKIKKQFEDQVNAKKAELDKTRNQLEEQKNKAAKETQNKLQQEGQKALDGLKKQFGF